jgi:hypothetical protein
MASALELLLQAKYKLTKPKNTKYPDFTAGFGLIIKKPF